MKKKIIRNLSIILCLVLAFTSLTACSKSDNNAAGGDDKIPTEVSDNSGHYEFKTHVHSTVMDDIFEPEMNEAYDRFIDAVLKGETSFECPDQNTYDWMMGQYSYLLFPVVNEYVSEPSAGPSFKDGVGYFEYKIPYEEFKVKLQDFEELVTGILNTALRDDFTDAEKALALYCYFEDNYKYDYDLYNSDALTQADVASAYHLLTEGKDICQGIGAAYSYLCLQAGVDATVARGIREYDGEHHQWSMVTINGEYYHVDPTYVLDKGYDLSYFLMTDEQRYKEDSYNPKDFGYTSNYYQEHSDKVYPCKDDTYSKLWDTCIVEWNKEKNIINVMNGYGEYFDFVM